MAKGYFIRKNDRTACGGVVLDSHPGVNMFGQEHCREGDRVTCGVDGQIYTIEGGISYITSHGKRVAGSLDSYSTCPCRAELLPSSTKSSYVSRSDNGPSTSGARKAHVDAVAARSVPPSTSKHSNPDAKVGVNVEEIEEEEEEVEQEQLITLRIGVFFDGTGNNQANSETVAGCMARDVGLQDQSEDIRQFCATYGYGVDGSTPDTSYGNDTSNVARLYELYVDQADISLGAEDEEASLKVYLEGIGTVSGGEDDRYGQATGRWGTGVLARAEQSSELVTERLQRFRRHNPEIKVKRVEVDVFGFSRGAAAARHFANDLRNAQKSLLAKTLSADPSAFAEGFAWRLEQDFCLNFIGLFDTVAGIVSPLAGDFSPGNARVSGLNLALSSNIARKVVQFVARDEHRLNFALTRTDHDILLPGAHSDIGGGYLPRSRERVLVSKPLHSLEHLHLSHERSSAFYQLRTSTDPWLRRLKANGIEWGTESWSVEQPRSRDELHPMQRVYVAAKVEREVYGDLSKIYLRIMRDLGVQHRVPFDAINERDARFALPKELTSIAEKLRAYVLHGLPTPNLTTPEEQLLFQRYIHLSANWNALMNFRNSDLDLIFINRPTHDYRRVTHANR